MFSNFVRSIGIFTTAVTSLSLLLSIIYNTLFFNQFHLDLLFSLSLADHIITSIRFLPFVAFSLLVILYGIICILDVARILNFKKPQTLESTAVQLLIKIVFLGIGIGFLLYWFFLGDLDSPYLYVIIWVFLGDILIENTQKIFSFSLSRADRWGIILFGSLCLTASVAGYNDAQAYISKPTEVRVKNVEGEISKYNYIRQLSNGLVVYKENNLYFLPSSQIASLEMNIIHETKHKSIVCKLFKLCMNRNNQQ